MAGGRRFTNCGNAGSIVWGALSGAAYGAAITAGAAALNMTAETTQYLIHHWDKLPKDFQNTILISSVVVMGLDAGQRAGAYWFGLGTGPVAAATTTSGDMPAGGESTTNPLLSEEERRAAEPASGGSAVARGGADDAAPAATDGSLQTGSDAAVRRPSAASAYSERSEGAGSDAAATSALAAGAALRAGGGTGSAADADDVEAGREGTASLEH